MNPTAPARRFRLPAHWGVRTRIALVFHGVVLLSLSLVGYYGYVNAGAAYRGKALESIAGQTAEIAQAITFFLREVPRDLRSMSQFHALEQLLYWEELGMEEKTMDWKITVIDAFRSLVAAREEIHELCFLDREGRERIRVLRDPTTGQVQTATGAGLRNRRPNIDFQVALALDRNRTQVSPLTLAMEQGVPRQPLLPVIRFAQPVIGANEVRYGVVMVEILAQSFLDMVRRADAGGDHRYYLISATGDYFHHRDPERTWGHLRGLPGTFRTDLPAAFAALQRSEQGAAEVGALVVSHHRIQPDPAVPEQHWFVVGLVDQARVLTQLNSFGLVFFTILAAAMGLVLLATRLALNGVLNPLAAMTRQLEKLGRGEVTPEPVAYPYRDEIGRVLASTNHLMDTLGNLTRQADTIAAGDYSKRVRVLSADDLLGNAINNMTAVLDKNRQAHARRTWLAEGLGGLGRELAGDPSLEELASRASAFLCRRLEAGHGAFFVFDRDDATGKPLVLMGSYMFTERDTVATRYALGEGAVGQVAREKQPILLRNVTRAEGLVTTGTLSVPPLVIIAVPLLYQEILQGVLELAAFTPLDEVQREFLDQAAGMVAAALFATLQRDRIATLLAKSESATRMTEDRNRQLQEVNAAMEEQRQQLQQQTEELQQANAQMEEQQQQLQQQTEELQQTNAQMEEQQQLLEGQAHDLTANNAALRDSQAELSARARQLEEADRYKSDFLANMSHELRTPLNSIILISRMMALNEDGTLDPETVRRARVVHNSGNDLLRLINDILDLSKIESGRMELHPESFDTGELAAELQDLFAETARERALDFRVEDAFHGPVVGDRNKVVQVLRNLLANAFKFTPHGTVALRCETGDDPQRPLRIHVADTGIGIPPDKLELIFEAFRQVDSSISRRFGGTGLGLSISRELTRLLGGSLQVASQEGEGSTFTLCLPTGPERTAARPAPLPPAAPRPALPAGTPAILVIDDDPNFLETIAIINHRQGLRTLQARSGQEGLALAAAHRPAGIILDLGLPDMDGDALLARIKTDPGLKEIPVFVISSRDRNPALLEQGAIGVLQKPVTAEQIQGAENALLAAMDRPHGAMLIVEGAALRAELVADRARPGSRQVAARSAAEALALAAGDAFDLVLVDHEPPDMDCAEFCRKLLERQPDAKIIIYAAGEIGEERVAQLRRFTDSLIQQAPQARQRLLEDIERFLAATLAQTRQHDQPGSPPPRRDSLLAGKRLLVVDDDPRNLFVLSEALEQHGAEVLSALNGRKALELLQEEPVDLVFMDIMMPEMDGYETMTRIRAIESLKRLPVIALTAKALKDDRHKCLEAGADDYLAKPVDYELLINMARAWIGKPR
ncbi:MAG: response regulator [Magnetococcales bacterium]|nr:response regulator [Magnetococcales bacterium]